MNINNLEIPSSFIEAISTDKLKRKIGSWELIKDEDAYGNLLETSIGDVNRQDYEIIFIKTDSLGNVYDEK